MLMFVIRGSGTIIRQDEILTEDAEPVEKVAVTLTSPGHVFPTYVTIEDGKYNFSNIVIPENYTLNAARNDTSQKRCINT